MNPNEDGITTIEERASAVVEFSPTERGLAALRDQYEGVAFDLRTTAGNDEARKARRDLVTLRTALEDRRKELKAPILARGKLIDDEAKRITAEIVKLEDPIDAQIKADEVRREEERKAKAAAEKARVARITRAISEIAAKGNSVIRLRTSASAQKVLDELSAMTIEEDFFEEYLDEAREAHATAKRAVCDVISALAEREAEAARLAEERAAIEREKAEAEARAAAQRKAEAHAAQVRADEEARLLALREDVERRDREQREREEAERQRAAAAEAAIEPEPQPQDEPPAEVSLWDREVSDLVDAMNGPEASKVEPAADVFPTIVDELEGPEEFGPPAELTIAQLEAFAREAVVIGAAVPIPAPLVHFARLVERAALAMAASEAE